MTGHHSVQAGIASVLNALGVKAVPYATEDIDIARREALAISGVPSFLNMLRATGIQLLLPLLSVPAEPESSAGR